MTASRIIAAAVALTLVGGTYISEAPRQFNTEIIACAADESSAFVLGDVDGNGLIDARDASAVLTEYAKLSTEKGGSFSSEEVKAADVDKNGLVDARDASSILGYYAYTSTTSTNECKSLEDFLNNADKSDKTTESPQGNPPTVPDIKVSYIVQDGTKVSVQFDSELGYDEYFTGMTVFRKESEEIGYVLYSDINFDDKTPDFSYVYDFWDNGEYRVTLYSSGHPEWYSDFTIDSIGAGVVTEDKFVDDKDPATQPPTNPPTQPVVTNPPATQPEPTQPPQTQPVVEEHTEYDPIAEARALCRTEQEFAWFDYAVEYMRSMGVTSELQLAGQAETYCWFCRECGEENVVLDDLNGQGIMAWYLAGYDDETGEEIWRRYR